MSLLSGCGAWCLVDRVCIIVGAGVIALLPLQGACLPACLRRFCAAMLPALDRRSAGKACLGALT